LWIHDCQLTDDGLAHLSQLHSLRLLNLRDTPITSAGIKTLGSVACSGDPGPVGTKVTDIGIEALAGNQTLRWLCLSQTAVTDAGLPCLARIPNLGGLDIARTRVTVSGLAQLQGVKLHHLA